MPEISLCLIISGYQANSMLVLKSHLCRTGGGEPLPQIDNKKLFFLYSEFLPDFVNFKYRSGKMISVRIVELISPLMTILFAYLNIKIRRFTDGEKSEDRSPEPEVEKVESGMSEDRS